MIAREFPARIDLFPENIVLKCYVSGGNELFCSFYIKRENRTAFTVFSRRRAVGQPYDK